jgi:hypothetical protein
MKYFALIFFIILSLTTFSQKDTLQVEVKKVSLGISYSPNYSYRVQVDDGASTYNDVIYLGKDDEVGQFGQTINFNVRILLTKHHNLNIGMQVSNEGYRTNNIDLIFGDVIDPRRGFVYPTTGLTGLTHKYKFNYGGLNIGLKSNYGSKSIRLIHSVGIVPKLLISGSAIGKLKNGNQTINTYDVRTTEDFNRFNLEAYISVGGEWEFKENRVIEFAPTFRFNVLKTSDDVFTSYLWSLGLRVGFFI